MYVVAVTLWVKPEFLTQFVDATLENARNTRREAGNVRFDLSQVDGEPTRFLLYEVYQVKEDFVKHQQTPHYLKWKETVTDYMAQPRQGVKHQSLFFGDGGKMAAFEFFGVGRIVFGRGKFALAGELAAGLGRTTLVIYNGANDVGQLIHLMSKAGVAGTPWRQKGEPMVEHVDEAVEEARRRNCDSIVGLGGGSAIDAAKAVAGLLSNGGSAVDYMEVVGKGKKISRLAAPWMAIPTTAGTGAEATRNAVIGFPEKKFKASIRSELLLPRVALVDAELGVSVPAAVTASSGMDALCQLIEAYTSTGASPVSDAVALQGIPIAAKSLLRAYQDGRDLEAREGMALAALLSGIALTNAGLGAVHGFAAPLGANFPVPHGTVCAALLPHVIGANVRAMKRSGSAENSRGLARYITVGRNLLGNESANDGESLEACVQFTAELAREMNIPPLKQFRIGTGDVGEMVGLARKSSSMRFNPVVLSDEELAGVLTAAIG